MAISEIIFRACVKRAKKIISEIAVQFHACEQCLTHVQYASFCILPEFLDKMVRIACQVLRCSLRTEATVNKHLNT